LRDCGGRETSSCALSAFAGFRFPRGVISVAVRRYLRYGLSYRDVERVLNSICLDWARMPAPLDWLTRRRRSTGSFITRRLRDGEGSGVAVAAV
jgi:hypothetical protein